jgi:acyl carrier protein
MNETIFERLKNRLLPLLRNRNPDDFTPQARLVDDLGADSMFMVEAAVAMEDEFGIDEVTDEDMAGMKTLGDMVRLIEDRTLAAR